METNKIAFQENESGEINGMIYDSLPFMSMYKISMWRAIHLILHLIGYCLFGCYVERLAYQWSIYRSLPKEENMLISNCLNLGFFIFGIIALSVDGDTLLSVGFTPLMKFWLLFPSSYHLSDISSCDSMEK